MFLKHLNPLNNLRAAAGVEIVTIIVKNLINYRKTTIKSLEDYKSSAYF
jgi:hypothetical protein